MRWRGLVLFVLFYAVSAAGTDYSAELIHFTKDGTAGGDSLYPGFRHHSCWNGAGVSSDGIVYVAISNHYQPSGPDEAYGDVAIVRYDPIAETLSALGKLSDVSKGVNNWMTGESQHKVHTEILEHADGKLYFATDDYEPAYFLRGSHLYSIDPAANTVSDFSATQPFVMKRDFSVIPNAGTLSDTAGIFIQYYGVKGIKMNKNVPDLMYAMLYGRPGMVPEAGHIIKYDLATGAMEKIGASEEVAYRMHVDSEGDLYFASKNGDVFDLMKYSHAEDTVTTMAAGFSASSIGGTAPSPSGDTVYLSSVEGQVFRLDCVADNIEEIGSICGGFSWLHFNLALSPDGRRLYYIIVQGNKGVFQINTITGICSKILDIADVTPNKTLCFDGINVWDKMGRLYIPVWDGGYSPVNLDLIKLELNQRTADNGFIAHPRVEQIKQPIGFSAHATEGVDTWHWDFGDGDTEVTTTYKATHTYQAVGQYTVTLTTTGSGSTRVYTRKNYIHATPEIFRIEGESMTLAGDYQIETGGKAGGTWIWLNYAEAADPDNMTGTATSVFTGPAGTYYLELSCVPENDGRPTVDLDLNGQDLGSWQYTSSAMYYTMTDRDLFSPGEVELSPGDTLMITGHSDNGAYARFDYLECRPVTGIGNTQPVYRHLPGLVLHGMPAKAGLSFSLVDRSDWTVRIRAMRGALIRDLGTVDCVWDGRDGAGRRMKTGMYVLELAGTGRTAYQAFMFVE